MSSRCSYALALALTGLAGCSSLPNQALKPVEAGAGAEVTVFRVHALNAGGVPLSVGVQGTPFATLANSEYAVAQLPAGTYPIFVQARSGNPTSVSITAKPGDKICLKTEADSANLAKAMLPPLLMISGYSFTLERVPCPSAQELSSYKQVAVAYQPTKESP